MLTSLQIKDYALIENIQVEFRKGLNIITGETGAGKSILVGALGLLLGERASTEAVRKGAKKAVVEGIFELESNGAVEKILSDNDIEFQPELIIRREVSLKGSNRCFINDTPVPLSLVKETGDLLVDLHGQHDHQSLLKPELHIRMLDSFSNLNSEMEKYTREREKLEELLKQLRELKSAERNIREKRELYEFQIKEIDRINPQPDEDVNIENEIKVLENSERLLELTNEVYSSLYEGENPLYDRIMEIRDKLGILAEIDNSFNEKEKECDSAAEVINDIAEFTRGYRDGIELEPKYLDELRERAGSIKMLKKKFGPALSDLLEYRKKIGEDFELAENFSGKIAELEEKIEAQRIKAGNHAKRLTGIREKSSAEIKGSIKKSLAGLGISDSDFRTSISALQSNNNVDNYLLVDGEKRGFDRFGCDEVEFYLSTNKGEDPKPLAKVASGGEISRVMLSMKSVLAKNDRLPLLIFDEIDTGVSGRIAQKTGRAMKELASFHQIIAITHLPQIAAFADYHYVVEKMDSEERTISVIRPLSEDEHIVEIAKLISGEGVSESALQNAKELIASC